MSRSLERVEARPVLGLLSVATLVACALALPGCGARQRYSIGMVNETGRDLNGVDVYYGERMAGSAGSLVKDGYATFSFVYGPVPAEAEVRWDEWPGGAHHASRVKLAGVVPSGFTEGTIYFIIKADGSVVVKTAGNDDRKARLDALDGLPRQDIPPKRGGWPDAQRMIERRRYTNLILLILWVALLCIGSWEALRSRRAKEPPARLRFWLGMAMAVMAAVGTALTIQSLLSH